MKSVILQLRDVLPMKDKGKVGILLCLMMLAGVFEVLGIGFILAFISQLADPTWISSVPWLASFFSSIGIVTSVDLLVYGSVALMLLFLLKNLYLVGYHYLQARFVHNRYRYISVALFKKYMDAPYSFHVGQNSSRLIRNVVVETRLLVSQIMMPLLFFMKEAIMIVSIVAFLLLMEPVVTITVSLLIGGIAGLFLKFVRSQTKQYGIQAHEDRALMIQKVNEGLGGIKEVRVLNRQSWFVAQFLDSMERTVRAETFKEISKQSIKPVIETFAVAGMLSIALVLLYQGREISSIIPVLTLFGVATFKLLPSLNRLVGEYNTLRFYSQGLEQIHRDMKEVNLSYGEERTMGEELDSAKIELGQSISLNNVSFSYPGSVDKVLDHISLTIQKGQAVGLVGPSGAGKTTIVDIVLGLLEPTAGTVLVDGVNIHQHTSAWQKNIGYIPQFIYLSDNTIKNNIAFGIDEKEISEEKIKHAIEMAQLDELVNQLPQGVDTVIGEGGIKLSGGQRQRIGIARALYHDPEVLIMDEATSSLDNKTEKYIVDAIETLKKDRTIIIIAHRLSTVENCDVLFVVERGRLVDSGTYSELKKRNQLFSSQE